jgi:hypothetical protein
VLVPVCEGSARKVSHAPVVCAKQCDSVQMKSKTAIAMQLLSMAKPGIVIGHFCCMVTIFCVLLF